MITFTPDIWAPGLDINVRRRPPSTDGKVTSLNYVTDSGLDSSLALEKTRPKSMSQLGSSDVASSFNTPGRKYVQINSDEAKEKTMTEPIVSAGSMPKKKASILLQKLFHGDNHKLSAAPLRQSLTEDKLLIPHKPLGNKIILRTILSPRLHDIHKSKCDPSDDSCDKECLLVKRYGMCDKECIGKGATAVVKLAHKAEGSECEKIYAVKEFRKKRKNETEKDYIKKLTSEFCISSTLDHMNIVKTVDLVQDENHNWCEVMEYCAGGDMFLAIKANHMTSVEIDCCFKQLINGVGYLHEMGVAHRDIKPENLLLNEHGYLKITDFGVSDVFRMHWESNPHLSKGLCGSEPYIAPEQFITSKEYDARLVDVWACGIVYYCMMYQGIPFRMAAPSDPNYLTYLEQRVLGQYEPFERLSSGCRDLMYHILEPDPCMRYDIDRIKADSWFKSIEICSDGSKTTKEHHHIAPEFLNKNKPPTKTKF